MQGVEVAQIRIGGSPVMLKLPTPELHPDLGRNKEEILSSVFRRWENQLLTSPFVGIYYRNKAEALKALRSALIRLPEYTDEKSDHLLYKLILGRESLKDCALKIQGIGQQGRDTIINQFILEQARNLQKERPFVTKEGLIRLASGGSDPKQGDLVCMMLGSPVPFILRKEGNYYRFLRPCYLEGYIEY